MNMRIQIADDDGNWLKWGELVQDWILDNEQRPGTVQELRDMMLKRGIDARVSGAADREVRFYPYPDEPGPLVIPLPSKKMLADKLADKKPGPYPNALMPGFYNAVYTYPTRINMTQAVSDAFALRRIGEYCVNECC
jgi:hypothetical protein